ncbi:fumarylacetoacetate hydrolase family protein [Candidatus Leptofilum sp.]|uniref:fumarylacetoacetate hydrolase family protein n=1 Tax=Candidatus Leptofilum sp. TaxID=3241576 RepID=UPI003B5CB8BF
MKFARYEVNGRSPKIGLVVDNELIDLSGVAPSMQAVINLSNEGMAMIAQHANRSSRLPLSEVKLLAPLLPRRNVMCLGKNYADHAHEMQKANDEPVELPKYPVVFTKATTAVSGPTDPVPFNPQLSEKMDYEVELALIIGKQGKNIPAEQAMEYVFGYMVLNDVTARDLQRQGKQFFKGKSLDGCCPTGPWIVTRDELPIPHDLEIRCLVNGEEKQASNTRNMIFDIPITIAYLSNGMTLLPGDIIATGTPDGVGAARTPPQFLRPGDVLTSIVEGVGELRNVVTAV